MSIKFTCAECGAKVREPDSSAGKRVACPKCHARIAVPEMIPDVAIEDVLDLSSASTPDVADVEPRAARVGDNGNPMKAKRARWAKPARVNDEVVDTPSGKSLSWLKLLAVGALLLLAIAVVGYGIWKLNSPSIDTVQSGGEIGPITPSPPPPTSPTLPGNRLIEIPLAEPEPIRTRPEDRIVYFESPRRYN